MSPEVQKKIIKETRILWKTQNTVSFPAEYHERWNSKSAKGK